MSRILLFVATIMLTSVAYAQDRCATDLFEKKSLQINPQQRAQFELWMNKKISQKRSLGAASRTMAVYKIPVVVHIIHNGEAIGTGTNISDAQVLSQMRVLNEDYKRLNADKVNTPAEFASVASSIDIEFVLAKQDPDGLPSNGITRTRGSRNGYRAYDDNAEIKAQNYWPSEDYLNIWVTNLIDDYLGLAQFPQTDLQGTTPPYEAITDGVVIHYKAFGSIADNAGFNLSTKYNLGRTTTHEVGHYLGLLHIFGNYNGCSNATDYVSDTPVQSTRTFSCPSSPTSDCGHHIMYQNFMDYTDDACMNLFTAGQIDRIQTVLENSPRRTSLLTSPGLQDPILLDLDLEAKEIGAPMAITCGKSITPRVVLRNRGSEIVTSAKVSFSVNASVIETKNITLNLDNLEATTVSFNTIDLPEPSTNNITYTILEVNGGTDEDAANDVISLTSQVTTRITPPALEAFNITPSNWSIVNPDNSISWANTTAPKSTASNKAMYLDFYDYQNLSAKDQLISPFYSIPEENAVLKFDHAYAMFPGISSESLRVLISVGCSADPDDAIEIFKKTGSQLATSPAREPEFIPTGESQWTNNGISLAPYVGENVKLIFETTNQNGNNLYLDNVQISVGQLNDIKIVSLVSPGPVFCESEPRPVIAVQNMGTETVTSLKIVTTLNGTVSASETITGLSMTPGALIELTLQALQLVQATNEIQISVNNPAVSDDLPSDNILVTKRILNSSADYIPIRQNFDGNISTWAIFSEAGQDAWVTANTNYNKSLVYRSFANADIGSESWFVSPALNFTRTDQAGLHFETSYGRKLSASEKLRVLVSEDCGMTYNEVIFEKSGLDLLDENIETEWTPGDTSDWTHQYISLNDFAGKDKVRFAFVATNDHGNNLYLDNIEFFVQDNVDPPRTEEDFVIYNNIDNPYEFFVTFNLQEKQDARLLIFNTMGQVLIDSTLPGTLNQTYTINLYGQSAGVYIARLLTPSFTRSAKVFIGK